MKKLIMAAAAITAGFAMADVVSSSVVGYQTKALGAGNFVITPSFEAVGGGEYNIDNLKVTGVPDTMANIQTMSAAGDWTGMYFWYNEAEYNGETLPSGWFDFNGVEPAGVTLKPGDAVFFYTDQEGAAIQTAGAVSVDKITLPVANGYTMLGNATPVQIDVDDLKVTGVPDTMANIQTMNAAGEWTGMYFWYNEAEYNGEILPSGWFDFNGVEPAGITLEPGDAVFFSTDQNGASVTMPAALPATTEN